MAHPFIVGETYFDRKGSFTVLEINRGTIRIRYDDGLEQTSDIEDKSRIYKNMLGEQRTLHPYQTPGYFDTLGFFVRHADFQAEVPSQAERGFEEEYAIRTGIRPVLGGGGYYPVRTHSPTGKWGPELRINFPDGRPIELPPGIEVRSGSAAGVVRINNNRFWWELVRAGFRLGIQHNATAIRDSIPAKFRADFDRGNV